MWRPSDKAWLTLAAGVITWDTLAAETLSQAAARYKTRRPVLTCAVICYLAAHLMELIPERLDPLSALGRIR